MTELKLRPAKTILISPEAFAKHENDFYGILYPAEQDQITASEIYELEGRKIYKYTLKPTTIGDFGLCRPVHCFVYFSGGALLDVTLYAEHESDKYEQASFKRIIESADFITLWNP